VSAGIKVALPAATRSRAGLLWWTWATPRDQGAVHEGVAAGAGRSGVQARQDRYVADQGEHQDHAAPQHATDEGAEPGR